MKKFLIVIILLAGLTACAQVDYNKGMDKQCETMLNQQHEAMEKANVVNLKGTKDWIQAHYLLQIADLQRQFGRYPNCIAKVQRAKYYIIAMQNKNNR